MTKKVIVHQGLTVKDPERDVYDKAYIGLEWDLPDEVDEETVAKTLIRMRSLVRQELGAPVLSQVTQFDTHDLMEHEWKGKKTGDGQYNKGSLAWGWDFKTEFKEETIKVLAKGPFTIDQYEFTMGETIVNVKKKKNSAR